MRKKATSSAKLLPKKAYKTPAVKWLGSAKKLTLKSGSATDGFGTFA